MVVTAFSREDDEGSDEEKEVFLESAKETQYFETKDESDEEKAHESSQDQLPEWYQALVAELPERKEWVQGVDQVAEFLAEEKCVHAMCGSCGSVFRMAELGEEFCEAVGQRKNRKVGGHLTDKEKVSNEEPVEPKEPRPGGPSSEKKEKQFKRPGRILPTACDWVHEHTETGVHPESSAECAVCQAASLRSRRRAKVDLTKQTVK